MIDRSNWVRYHATNIEYALDVSVSPGEDLDGIVYMAYCHDENEYLKIDAYQFEWEVA